MGVLYGIFQKIHPSVGEDSAIMGVLYGIFQKIHPSVGEDTAIMGVCPTHIGSLPASPSRF
ncbi:hypothetical protein ACVRXQ_09810 [Streptococcus panodentis]|uniref:Uncharacterized protein n=1 Tax=Streptococcus panodentis TaxID=1581472 RepID=A0ABS5AW69_9STRE|nr:hypothetical protein [Streptococcus panodentis]MBP2620822.1 hypothetical protein [Streptococcus panodentis]